MVSLTHANIRVAPAGLQDTQWIKALEDAWPPELWEEAEEEGQSPRNGAPA